MSNTVPGHEAGHALMGFLLGRTIESVTVSGCNGLTTSVRRRAETIHERVAVHAAGVTAELVLFGGSLSFAGAADDARNIDDAIAQHLRMNPGADGRRIYAQSMAEARRVLCANRFALTALADHLRRHGRATHSDIQFITTETRRIHR